MGIPSAGSPTGPKSASPGARSSSRSQVWAMAVTMLLGLVLLEGAAETFWRGSAIRWWILIAVGTWALAMVPAALFLKWGARLWLTTVSVLGVIVFADWRMGPSTDPSLTVLTLPLPHLLPLLVVVALLLFGSLIVRMRIMQRLPLLMVIALLLTLYCLLPFAFAAVYGTAIDAAVVGKSFWTAPPLWLQGGFLALQGLVPLGFVLAVFVWLGLVAGRKRRGSAVFPAVCGLVFAAAFTVGSVALARAGIPNLASRFAPGWLPQPIGPAAPGVPSGPAVSAPSGAVVSPPGPGTPPNPEVVPQGRSATTKALDLAVDGVEFVAALGDRAAPPGQTFVVLRTIWKRPNAPAAGPAVTAPAAYVVPSLPRSLWLLADSRYAEAIDEAATQTLAGHLPLGPLTVPASGETVLGSVVFRTSASASYLALVLIDAASGNAVVAVKGRPADAPPAPMLGAARSNELVTLVATEAGWSEGAPTAPPGLRYFTLGLRGTGLARDDLQTLDFDGAAFLQTDQGFVAEPEQAAWLRRPFARPAVFLPDYPNEGQLAFLLPADSRQVQLLFRPKSSGPIDLPVSQAFVPAWPQPVGTITDGATLRVLRLPPPALPQGLPVPRTGLRYLAIDVLVQNLKAAQPIEFQIARQLRVVDANGVAYAAAPESRGMPLRPTGRAVIPAAAARRFQQLYLVPVDQPLRLEYRGFERSETVDIGTPPLR